MKKMHMDVSGMHCRSCELILERSIKKLNNVSSVNANEKKGSIDITYDKEVDTDAIKKIIEENGYTIGKESKAPWFHKNMNEYVDLVVIAITFFAIYLVLNAAGFSFGGIGSTGTPTFTVALIVGLTAGISSCMALVGGLVLGVSAKWSEGNIQATKWDKFQPHLFFNIGRIVGFGLLGGILGIFGSIFSLSPLVIGLLMLATGIIMLMLGINLADISPRLSRLSITLPKFLSPDIGNGKSSSSKHTLALTSGALTFFLPCGFTLAMQAYAMTTGNFFSGAMIMMAFAIGTAPGLLGVGGLTSLFKGKAAKKFFKITGVLVIMLSFFNMSNAVNLISLGNPGKILAAIEANPGQVQEIRMTQSGDGYSPNIFHVKPNTKIRWIITATNPYSCSTQIMIPSIGVTKNLVKGENVIEFISPSDGEINFSCSMGMYPGKIIVDGIDSATITDPASATTASASNGKSFGGCSAKGTSGGGCGGGSAAATGGTQRKGGCNMGGTTAAQQPAANIDTTPTKTTESTDGVEEIAAVYTSNGMSPQQFNLKSGKTYRLTIDVKDTIQGCMSSIYIPGIDENIQGLVAGTKVVFNIKADQTGQFPLTCAMGVPHGFVIID